ncbi:hypothetical protein ABZX77_22025 [Streptomyces sp. NPDC004237]|uniref:hypothetical protein n=1 Tax=Streptomyces sp. NPDC004237 TaxID=3154455 RepID=UPI0033A3B7AF
MFSTDPAPVWKPQPIGAAVADRATLTLRDLRHRPVLMTSAKVHPSVMGEQRSALLAAGVTRLVSLPPQRRRPDRRPCSAHRRPGPHRPRRGPPHRPRLRLRRLPPRPLDEPGLSLRVGIAWRPDADRSVPGLREAPAALRERYGEAPAAL